MPNAERRLRRITRHPSLHTPMKKLLPLLVLLAAVSARAAGIGAFVGKMDTDTLGKSLVYGAQLDFDFVPSLSLLVRGGYANDFDDYAFVGSSGTLVADDLAIVPVEAGLLLRPPMVFDCLGIYGGGGVGWYGIPGFDVRGGDKTVAETDDVWDLVGWWVAAGVEVGTESFRVFGEVKYQSAEEKDLELEFKDRSDMGSLRSDMDLAGVTFLAGVRVAW